jgi:hypothetical protein
LPVLTLLEKVYGPKEANARQKLDEILSSFTSGLDAEIKFKSKNRRNWIQVEVSGSDITVAVNYLAKRFGLVSSSTDIRIPMTLKGKIVDSGTVGYGLYVDVGVSASDPLDALIPLYSLRSHLTEGRKLSLRRILDAFCLHDNFPVSVRLTKVDQGEKKIWVEPSEEQVDLFRVWRHTYLDRVVVLGAHREQIMIALTQSGVKRDIARVIELGFMEYALLCKLGTDAPGVIKVLGRYLSKVPLYPFSPRKINSIIDEPFPSINS